MKRALYALLALVVMGYLGVCAFVYARQRSLLYFPQSRAVTAPESTMRLPVDGAELVVTVLGLTLARRPSSTSAGMRMTSQEPWPRSPDGSPTMRCSCSTTEVYGGSTGLPTEQSNHADAAALFRTFRPTPGRGDCRTQPRLGCGGAAGERAARASRLVLIARRMTASKSSPRPIRFFRCRGCCSTSTNHGQCAGHQDPTTLIAAANDRVIPPASSERLFSRFGKGVASMIVIPDAGHNDVVRKPEFRDALRTAVSPASEQRLSQ